ncbi:hypothetical protein BCPG_04524 [Burkholderia cenocepacia PC184]|nr:hypothetical protein BCPG_04524 [Burkholderia cenocepacia PC184]
MASGGRDVGSGCRARRVRRRCAAVHFGRAADHPGAMHRQRLEQLHGQCPGHVQRRFRRDPAIDG